MTQPGQDEICITVSVKPAPKGAKAAVFASIRGRGGDYPFRHLTDQGIFAIPLHDQDTLVRDLVFLHLDEEKSAAQVVYWTLDAGNLTRHHITAYFGTPAGEDAPRWVQAVEQTHEERLSSEPLETFVINTWPKTSEHVPAWQVALERERNEHAYKVEYDWNTLAETPVFHIRRYGVSVAGGSTKYESGDKYDLSMWNANDNDLVDMTVPKKPSDEQLIETYLRATYGDPTMKGGQ